MFISKNVKEAECSVAADPSKLMAQAKGACGIISNVIKTTGMPVLPTILFVLTS